MGVARESVIVSLLLNTLGVASEWSCEDRWVWPVSVEFCR